MLKCYDLSKFFGYVVLYVLFSRRSKNCLIDFIVRAILEFRSKPYERNMREITQALYWDSNPEISDSELN